MKRTFAHISDLSLPAAKRTRSNKRAIVKPLKEIAEWISATEFDSFCQKDPVVDWLSNVDKNIESAVESDSGSHPLSFLFEKGRHHEDNIINELRQKTGLLLEKQSSLTTSRLYTDSYDKKDMSHTIECMRRGDDLIYSPYLSDQTRRVRGIPDLLIRNDYVATLFPTLCKLPDHSGHTSAFGSYYYLPVEVKFSSIHLAADGVHVLNGGRNKFYKTQLYTYCSILETIQHINPLCSLLIGKRTIGKTGISYSIIRPGLIDYSGYDQDIPSLFEEGLEWLRLVKKNGMGWDVSPETLKKYNLFPNMKVDNALFQKDKKELADTYGEITEIWQCGVKHRENAIEHGIISWKDARLTGNLMNVPKAYEKSIDMLLKVNRGELGDYHPLALTKNTNQFMEKSNEMFVDFETVRDSFDLDSFGTEERIFLIGVYYKGEYRSFRLSQLTSSAEKDMLQSFINFWEASKSPRCWFWYAEMEFWRRALLRNPSIVKNPEWVDLYQVVKEEPFVVKGCKNFKLKSYITSLRDLGKIDIKPPPDTCGNGLEALTIAYQHYRVEKNEKRFDDIIQYNKFDCEALYQILTFLRTLK
jgi:uncharacterized protein YprB with RNaseH-like and TPR domain